MILTVSHPTLILKLCGFKPAPDRGWQIAYKWQQRPRKGREWVPTERLHALVVGQEINLHLDVKKGRYKHKALRTSHRVQTYAYIIKGLDNAMKQNE